MSDDTVPVTVELPRETYETLETPENRLAELAAEEARMQASIETYLEDGDLVRGMMEGVPAPVGVLVGFEVVEFEPGHAVVELAAGPRHANPMGTVHGGVFCDLGDAAMGYAFATTLGQAESFTTVELDVKYLKPVWEGTITAEADVVKQGSTVGLVECDVTDEEGSLVARLESLCLTLRDEMAAGR
jgi:uncharacterized protein (TIGR00369 family)